MSNPVVADPKEVVAIADALRGETVIGIDTEFLRETTFFPKVALIQLSTHEKTWLLDPVALTPDDLAPILEVLVDPKVLKLMHAAFADQECLYWAYGKLATPVLDTAVAAAMSGYGDNIGLGKLLKDVLGVYVPKGRARVKWLQRPLPRELIHYAEQDVAHMVPLGKSLIQELQARGRYDWAIEESRLEPRHFDTEPAEITRRLSKNGQFDQVSVAALARLVAWREDRAKKANLPRPWIADNEILCALAKTRPRTLEELRSFRGLSVKEIDRNGAEILRRLRDAEANPDTSFEPPTRLPALTDSEDHVLDLIKAFVTFLSAQHALAARFILGSGKSTVLLRNSEKSVSDWIELGILTQQAAELVGEDLKALLEGRRALTLKNRRLEILKF